MIRSVRTAGFTLVELSIVLVIIGLIIGGVLVGRDMTDSAETRAVISEYDQLITAVTAFKGKYNALPGDMNYAESVWGSDAGCPGTAYNTIPKQATCNGNGNGTIGIYDAADAYENARFFQHLANAGLIAGQYTGVHGPTACNYCFSIDVSVPRSKIRSAGWTMYGAFRTDAASPNLYLRYYEHLLFFGTSRNNAESSNPALTAQQAYAIDTKMDDGKPGQGIFTSGNPSFYTAAPCVTSNNVTTATYLVDQTGIRCQLIINLRL